MPSQGESSPPQVYFKQVNARNTSERQDITLTKAYELSQNSRENTPAHAAYSPIQPPV